MSRGKGVGFFEAGNFHPDFILWMLIGWKQYVTFTDPQRAQPLIDRLEGFRPGGHSMYQRVMVGAVRTHIDSRLGLPDAMPALR